MKSTEFFAGFDAREQARHEEYLINRYGTEMKAGIEESKRKVKNWTQKDWEKASNAFGQICKDLVALMAASTPVVSAEAQAVIRRHFEWLKNFWMPNRESYTGHSELIVDSELRKAYETYHAGLPEYIAAGIKHFAANLPETNR